MSYSVIFETKICKLSNGDIIHFNRSGCNNDTSGRRRDEFTGKYYTAEAWETEIRKYETMERPTEEGDWELKIGSRYCAYADYGKHLRTMTKRAKTFDELTAMNIQGTVFDGIAYISEDGKETLYSADDPNANKIIHKVMFGNIKGKCYARRHCINTEADIVEAIKAKKHVQFYIGK